MAARPFGLTLRLLVAALALALAACGGTPPDLGTVRPRDPPPDMDYERTVVTIEGFVPAPARTSPDFVEIDRDGRAMTVFFEGGDPHCFGVAGVEVQRRDPELPTVTVLYGTRFGNMGCTAALASLAIRQALVPPFEP
jgi:hypothetical protein